jgi:hypothetical protein
MTEYPIPDPGLTESTRHMYSEKYRETFNSFIDEVFRPNHIPAPKAVDHSILIDELELMREAHLTIGGEQNRFNASVLLAALNVIRAL